MKCPYCESEKVGVITHMKKEMLRCFSCGKLIFHPTCWKYNKARTFRHRKLNGITTEIEYLEGKK